MNYADATRIIREVHHAASVPGNRLGPYAPCAGHVVAATPWTMLDLAVDDNPGDLPEGDLPNTPRIAARTPVGAIRLDPKLLSRVVRFWPGPIALTATDANTIRVEGEDGSYAVVAGLERQED